MIGIIGRNGVGKSTLLKILSRITESTEGYVQRLNVQTFKRSNVSGMKKAEIERKEVTLDEN